MTNWVLERLIEFKTAGSRWDPVVVYATQPVVVYATQPVVVYATQPVVVYATQPVVVYATQPVVVYATQADAERAKRCLPVGGSAQGGIIREFRVRELVD